MKYYATIILILLLISTVTATQIESSKDLRISIDKKPVRFPINDTNFSINITFPINDTNITIPINETNITIPINETNITIPINETNFSINITIPINDTNITTPANNTNNSLLNITGEGIKDLFNITQNKTIVPTNKSGTTTYFYAGSKLLASKNNEEVEYFHQDRLNNNRINTKTNGELIGEFKSLPFGQELLNTVGRFSFTGKEFDGELYYFGARHIDPDLGKFTNKDPVSEEPPYAYVHNNPMNLIDEDGKQAGVPPNNPQGNAADIDSLIIRTSPDTIQVGRPTRGTPIGSTIAFDYSDQTLRTYLRRGVQEFERALADTSVSFDEAVARVDSLSWRGTVPYDRARTGHTNRDSLETAIYGDRTNPPDLSEFFDGNMPDAVCREYVGLTIAVLRIASERNQNEFNGRDISIMSIFGERQMHHRTAAGADSVVTNPVGHSVISISDPTGTRNFITWGSVYTQQQLETHFNRRTNADPTWTTGGFDFNHRGTWENILTLFR